MNAYLLLLLHPANRIPRIPTEDRAIEKRIPSGMSARARPWPRGITDHPRSAKVSVIIGAINRSTRFDMLGIMVSLTTSLRASATLIIKSLLFFMIMRCCIIIKSSSRNMAIKYLS